MRFLKNLIWLVKHKKEIEELLDKRKTVSGKRYAVGNVPDFQMEFVNNVLNEKK